MKSEEEQAATKARETQAIADDAQRDLSEALPALVRLSLCSVISAVVSQRLCLVLVTFSAIVFIFSL